MFGGDLRDHLCPDHDSPQEQRLSHQEVCSNLPYPSLNLSYERTFLRASGEFGVFKAGAIYLLAGCSVNLSPFATLTCWCCLASLCVGHRDFISPTVGIIKILIFLAVELSTSYLTFLSLSFHICTLRSKKCWLVGIF